MQQVTMFFVPGDKDGLVFLCSMEASTSFFGRVSISVARLVNDFITTVFATETRAMDGDDSGDAISDCCRLVVFMLLLVRALASVTVLEAAAGSEAGGDFNTNNRFKVAIVLTSTMPDSIAFRTPSMSSAGDFVWLSAIARGFAIDFRPLITAT